MEYPPPNRTKSVTLQDPNDEISDEEAEQTTPMMHHAGQKVTDEVGHHQAAAALGSHLYRSGGDDNQSYVMDGGIERQVSPTGKLAWVGFGLSVFALTCMCIAFASPYWIQQWPNSFSTFQNMGLWEVCFHNYMHHRDDLQEIYNGCFWVFDGSERYQKLRDWLLPPWFLAVQVMSTAILLVEISVVVVTALVFLHMCPMMNHEYHQIFAMFISGAMMFLATMTSIIVLVLFGVQVNDRNWQPRPDWNFLSWGFGFCTLSGMFAFGSGMLLFISAWQSYNKLLRLQDDYFKQAMDMTAQYAPSQSQASYGVGYSDKPSYTDQPSYDKPSYGQSQSSYGYPEKSDYPQEKPGYDAQRSYDNDPQQPYYDRQPSQRSGYSAQQPQYDGNQSYDRSFDRSYDQGYDPQAQYQPPATSAGYDQGGYGQQGGYGGGGAGYGQSRPI